MSTSESEDEKPYAEARSRHRKLKRVSRFLDSTDDEEEESIRKVKSKKIRDEEPRDDLDEKSGSENEDRIPGRSKHSISESELGNKKVLKRFRNY